jgi:hypothetical protein
VVTSLVRVSRGTLAEPAEVQGVAAVATDGSRVYFVARGVLTEGLNGEGQAPVRGADNLYVYSAATSSTAFIASLCSGPATSGAVADSSCPSDLSAQETKDGRNDFSLWLASPATREVQTAGPGEDPGRFLLFSSYAKLIGRGPQADVDDAKDVYRYDAQTGLLDRVSVGEGGADSNGNCSDAPGGSECDAVINDLNLAPDSLHVQRGMETRAISSDGSRVVFETAAPLSHAASNDVTDVYEWSQGGSSPEGHVSLVSDGRSPVAETDAVMSPSGQDIFFETSQGLVSQDTDGQADVYDARLGGGFPAVPAEPAPCSGDACQGPLRNPAPSLVPGSAVQLSGENFAAPAVVAKPKVRSVKCRKGRRLRRGKCVVAKPKRKKSNAHGARGVSR